MPSYAEAVKLFETKYGITVNFEPVMTAEKKMDFLNNYLFEKGSDPSRANVYKRGLAYFLASHIEKKTELTPGDSGYNLSKLDLAYFIADYEDLMQAKFESEPENKGKTRQRYEGEGKNLMDYLGATVAAYDKPLSDIWARKIATDKMTFEDFEKMIEDEHRYIEENRANSVDLSVKERANNVFIAEKAMKKLRSERSILWVIINPWQTIKQYFYSRKLTQRVAEYRTQGIAEPTREKFATSLMTDAIERRNRQHEENTQVSQHKKNGIDTENFRRALGIRSIINLTKNEGAIGDLKNTLAGLLPGDGERNADIFALYATNGHLENHLLKLADTLGQHAREGMDSEGQMEEAVRGVYDWAERIATLMGYHEAKDKVVASQLITDMIMKKFPLVSDNKEKYERFANGYVLNNPDKFIEDAKTNNFYESDMRVNNEAKEIYNSMDRAVLDDRERNSIEIHLGDDLPNDKSDRIIAKEVPSINAKTT